MKTTMKLGMAAAAFAFGLVGNVLAEGSTDFSSASGLQSSAQTQRLAVQQARKIWGDGRIGQGFHSEETSPFDRNTGNSGG